MKVGDVVVPLRDSGFFHSGNEWYTHAICVQVEPLVLVSQETDMRWESTLEDILVRSLCQAHPDIVAACMRRLAE